MKAWVARGTHRQPQLPRWRGASRCGHSVLTVAINRDGSIKRMDIIRGSGHKVLDDAAQRTVQLSALPPLPRTGGTWTGSITRTWQYLPGDDGQPLKRAAASRRRSIRAAPIPYNGAIRGFESLSNHLRRHAIAARSQFRARRDRPLCQHGEDGAMGLVINRLSEYRLGDVLAQMGIQTDLAEVRDAPVLLGGPVQPERGFLHEVGGEWESSFPASATRCA